jgi:hypothetical protein
MQLHKNDLIPGMHLIILSPFIVLSNNRIQCVHNSKLDFPNYIILMMAVCGLVHFNCDYTTEY